MSLHSYFVVSSVVTIRKISRAKRRSICSEQFATIITMTAIFPTFARRLDDVRKAVGVRGVRPFWLGLGTKENGPEVVTWDSHGETRRVAYSAARLYHSMTRGEHREPPAFYLARVAEVYGVRLEWLLNGEGEMLHSEAEANERVEAERADLVAIWRRGGIPAGLEPDVIDAFVSVVKAIHVVDIGVADRRGDPPRDVREIAEVTKLLTISVLREIDHALHPDETNAHLRAMLLAIRLAYPLRPGQRGWAMP